VTEDVLLSAERLQMHFPVRRGLLRRKVGAVQAVDGLTFDVRRGETLSLVGESGCGKTTTGRLLTRLLEPTDGTVTFEGRDISHLGVSEMRPLRRDIQMVFQDPYSSLNPRHTVGTIIGAPFKIQGVEPKGGVKQAVQDLLALVGLSPEHYNRYPHEFSGGQRQRIGIARTLALRPKLIIADEPVSALDVSIQAQVANLLGRLARERGLALLLISHDLGIVHHVADVVSVMYLGVIVETARTRELWAAPQHPYTEALIAAIPHADGAGLLPEALPGEVPDPAQPPSGCRFHPRCAHVFDRCSVEVPPLYALGGERTAACFLRDTGVVADAESRTPAKETT